VLARARPDSDSVDLLARRATVVEQGAGGPYGMHGISKTKAIVLWLGVALALSVVASPTASASEVLVLKAGGQPVPNGALINVTMAERPEYIFKTHVTVQGSAPAEVEVECENYLEQGRLERTPNGGFRIVQTTPVEICEGEPWLEEGIVENRLSFSPPNIATDESNVELFRTEEAIRAEERKQAEKGEEIHVREPRRCGFKTTVSKGTFSRKTKKPLIIKIKNRMSGIPVNNGRGCFPKAKWTGSFAISYKGQPVFVSFATGPSVTGLSPVEGAEAGGTSVQISGSGFSAASAVTFGATSATSFTVNSDSSITATAPKGTGTVDVTVSTPVGTSATSAADHYTYAGVPSVTEIAPTGGPESGGREVTITGTNFTSGSKVKFGTAAASSVKVNSSSSITATAPPGTGTVDVTVTTVGGTSTTSSADQFTYM
jgi:IPT/TIG domain